MDMLDAREGIAQGEAVKPMHPRKRLQWIINETRQFIIDTQSWNDNRPESEAMDCEAERVTLNMAMQAAAEWDSGDIEKSQATMKLMVEYAIRADD